MNYWDILHDSGKPLCFVGNTVLNQQFMNDRLGDNQFKEICSLEHIQSQTQEWFDQRQFITVTGDVVLKKQIIQELNNRQAAIFSIVGTQNLMHKDIVIGRGTFINNFNDMLISGIDIGNYCVISCYCQFGRNVILHDHSHVASYCYINDCIVGEGVAIGARASIVGVSLPGLDTKTIASYTNLLINSTVTKSITEAGTYHGNRRINDMTRLEYRIV
jgi:acetyltransferase-like isoleucine patch superfamily enzyme